MARYRFPQSVRKYIRLCKADIRRQILDMAEQERRISKLYEDMVQKYQVKGIQAKEDVPSVIPPEELKKEAVKASK